MKCHNIYKKIYFKKILLIILNFIIFVSFYLINVYQVFSDEDTTLPVLDESTTTNIIFEPQPDINVLPQDILDPELEINNTTSIMEQVVVTSTNEKEPTTSTSTASTIENFSTSSISNENQNLVSNLLIEKNSYSLPEIIQISNSQIGSAIAIYWLDNPDTLNNPDPESRPSFVYATMVGDDGTVSIEASTLNPGNYVFVNTFEPEYCSGLYLSQCRQRSDYLGEVVITIY